MRESEKSKEFFKSVFKLKIVFALFETFNRWISQLHLYSEGATSQKHKKDSNFEEVAKLMNKKWPGLN